MLKTFLLFFFSALATGMVFSQPLVTINDSSSTAINNYGLLLDRGYSFSNILTDTSLHFITNDSLRPAKEKAYWLKIKIANPMQYAEAYQVWVRPYLRNILYYFNANAQQWVAQEAGLLSPSDNNRSRGEMPFVLQGQAQNTLYIKVDISPLRQYGLAFIPKIFLKKEAIAHKQETRLWIAWATAIAVLLLFFLNNLYIYYSFRDKAVLHYLIIQLGGMMYITAYREIFNIVSPGVVYRIFMEANGRLYDYGFNNLMMHISVLIIMYGFIQLTRSYLYTQKNLPRLDALLRYGLSIYTVVTFALIITNIFLFYVDDYVLLYDNILVLLLILATIGTSTAGYVTKLPSAIPFLWANMLPLVLMLATALYHIFISFTNTDNSLLPELAVMFQAICFSIALVARIKYIRYQLAAKELEAKQLAFNMRELELKHQLVALENEKVNTQILAEKTQNELLHEKLEANQRELASTTLYMVQKNELLATLKMQIKELNLHYPNNKQQGLQGIQSILQSNLYLDDDWGKFKLHFEQVHPNFFKELQAKYPLLTKNEIRLHAYFHINLTTKEIAALLNIDPASVRRAKTRLGKKMAL